MNKQKFEQICRESRVMPIGREETKNASILLGEKLIQGENGPEYEMLWAIDRDELDIAGIAKCPAYIDLGFTTLPTTREERRAAAVAEAKQFIADSITAGRYA